MNKLTIIGNLTGKPELRYVNGNNGQIPVASFTVAVNSRKNDEATFFRVTAWRGLAENCSKHLDNGRKVAVIGEVSCHRYTNRSGEARASLDVTASEVEFLSSAQNYTPVDSAEAQAAFAPEPEQQNMGDLPF